MFSRAMRRVGALRFHSQGRVPHNGRMQPEENELRRLAWSSYWSTGALHSCAGSYADNYDDAIGAFWSDVFAKLRANDRVLDLATGNGALPRMLWERSAEHGVPVRVDAVDLAEVMPDWIQPDVHAGIAFHSGVRMEALPFPDQAFDLVASQFGFEYAQWPQALDEAARVLRPCGSAAFVLHHVDSVIVRMGQQELEDQRVLLADEGLLDAAAAMLPWLALARANDAAANGADARATRDRYNHAQGRLGALIDAGESRHLLVEAREYVHGIAAGRFGKDAQHQQRLLADFRAALESAGVRTREMLECALDQRGIDAFVLALRERLQGRMVSTQTLTQAEGLLGWAVVAAA